jgi:hypothetical protein
VYWLLPGTGPRAMNLVGGGEAAGDA